MANSNGPSNENSKTKQLQQYRVKNAGQQLTNDAGLKVANNEWSLRAGERGPVLFQDSHFYKKQSHFHRERIPEKVVHARGFGVHGEFECTYSMKAHTRAGFLQEPGLKTPVFVRFSTFIGSKGSKDTAIDVRGFATKFYTREGNYDNLGLSFPVFVLQDPMKFADVVHAIKPNPVTDVPQAAAAHDNFWDYVANNQESAHFIMWLMSGRGRPRSWRMMEGYPINAFRFVNEQGASSFVRFVWKPALGVHSLQLEEANIIGGVDPDFHRHDIIEAIEKKVYPQYSLGVQLIPEEDEFKYDFDVLDVTKLWPEEIVPVLIIGKMTLNRLADNYFAESEQSSFDPANLVPGIAFSNDPVLQGRAFAYRDTDYHRLGTSNIQSIPINQPLANTYYNQRDGYVRHRIDIDEVNYHRNSLANNTPAEVPPGEGGYVHYPEKVEGHITRERPSESFGDYFSQARLFYNSMSAAEKKNLLITFNYHVGKVISKSVRQQIVDMFANVDQEFATKIAEHVGVNPPRGSHVNVTAKSPVISEANTIYSPATQKVGILVGDGFDGPEVKKVIDALNQNLVFFDVISERLGPIVGTDNTELEANKLFITTSPVLYDSLYIVGGNARDQSKFSLEIMSFLNLAYKHYKPIGISKGAESYMEKTGNLAGVIFAQDSPNFADEFLAAIAKQRFWERT
ncbi:MAG: catalase [Firmicutes bacterium]|nr:catalase [Bacillota bacterium]